MSTDKMMSATEIVLEIDKHAPDTFPSMFLESIEKSINNLVSQALQQERERLRTKVRKLGTKPHGDDNQRSFVHGRNGAMSEILIYLNSLDQPKEE